MITNIDKELKQVDKILKPLPALNFDIKSTKNIKKPLIFENKLGGAPWWPANKPFPVDKNKKKMALLVQLNFSKLPKIEDFPDHGLLQIFIADDDGYGFDYYNPTKQSNFKVIYHENYDKNQTMQTYNYYLKHSDSYGLPIHGEYLLVPKKSIKMVVDPNTYNFEEIFIDILHKNGENQDIESSYDLPEELYDYLYNRSDRDSAFIGGYPIFSQDDPRYKKEYQKYDTVLFELDSYTDNKNDIDIIWGDAGTGAFFISKDNLKKLDFSDILYNFDCC